MEEERFFFPLCHFVSSTPDLQITLSEVTSSTKSSILDCSKIGEVRKACASDGISVSGNYHCIQPNVPYCKTFPQTNK